MSNTTPTPRDRATALINDYFSALHFGDYPDQDELAGIVEKEILAAEQRGREAERTACEALCRQKALIAAQDMIEYAKLPHEKKSASKRVDIQTCGEIATVLANEIAARKASSE